MVADTSMMRSESSNSGSVAIGRRNNEVDVIKNPTDLFRKINSSDWDGALNIVKNNPSDASMWISRSKDNGPAWKYLPLHLICLQQHPHEELFMALLQSYPQAASLPTPHDGNLPIHYACESGCDNEHVFAALLASFPQSLEVENNKSKTPLLMCHVKSRGLLMKVLRQRKPLPFNNGVGAQPKKKHHTYQPQTKKRERKDRKSTGGRSSSKLETSERRNDIDTSWKDSSEHSKRHCPPKTTPARFVVTTDEMPEWDDTITPRVSNHRRSSKKGTKKDHVVEPFFPEEAASASSSEYDTDGTTASYISTKTTEFAMTALNYLYPSYQDTGQPPDVQEREENKGNFVQDDQKRKIRLLTRENVEQQRTIENLTKKLAEKSTTSSNSEGSSGSENNSTDQLCDRILKKAEADNVAFRTQIQQLENKKDTMRRIMEVKDKENSKRFDQIKQILRDRAAGMKINIFDDDSASCDSDNSSDNKDRDQIVAALQTVLSHMDDRNANLHSKITSLETDLAQSEVSLKKMQIKNQNMVNEKESMSKYYHSVERKASILEEDKEMVQSGLTQLKDRVTSLTVINQSLQEQIDSISSDQVRQENVQFKSELDRLNAQLTQMKLDAPQPKYSQEQVAEMEKKIEDLSHKNRSLKENILSNNDKYSKKVQVLTEANKDLRDSLARVRSKSCNSSSSESSMKVHLEGENKLLYEV